MVVNLDSKNFDEVIGSGKVLVKFTAEWCTYCRMLEPLIQQLAEDLDGQAVVAELDTDANEEIAARYEVMTIPTVILFKDGQEQKRMVNTQSKAAYIQAVEEL